MAPDFLADQIERSRANLDVDTIDVFYLHNPETQLGFATRAEFDARIRRGVRARWSNWWSSTRSAGTARPPGTASGRKDALSLPRLAEIAARGGRTGASFPLHPASVQSGDGGSIRREAGERAGRGRPAGNHGGGERHPAADAGAGTDAGSARRDCCRGSPAMRSAPSSSRARRRASRGAGRHGHGASTCSRTSAWRGVPPAPRDQYLQALPVMTTIEVGDDLAQLDAALAALPNSPAVFLLWPQGGRSVPFEDRRCCAAACCVCSRSARSLRAC